MAKLKLQDALEVFFDKLESVGQKFDANNRINSVLERKINEIQKTTIKVETQPYEKLIEKSSDLFVKHSKELSLITEKHSKDIIQSVKNESKYQMYFYISLTILFCLCFSFLAFGISQYHKKQEVEKKLSFYLRYSNEMEKYLKHKKLNNSFDNWKTNKESSQK